MSPDTMTKVRQTIETHKNHDKEVQNSKHFQTFKIFSLELWLSSFSKLNAALNLQYRLLCTKQPHIWVSKVVEEISASTGHTHYFPLLHAHSTAYEFHSNQKYNFGSNPRKTLEEAIRHDKDERPAGTCWALRSEWRIKILSKLFNSRKMYQSSVESAFVFLRGVLPGKLQASTLTKREEWSKWSIGPPLSNSIHFRTKRNFLVGPFFCRVYHVRHVQYLTWLIFAHGICMLVKNALS